VCFFLIYWERAGEKAANAFEEQANLVQFLREEIALLDDGENILIKMDREITAFRRVIDPVNFPARTKCD
jgi:hypothetical protein